MEKLEDIIKKLENDLKIKESLLQDETNKREQIDLAYKQLASKEKQRVNMLKSTTGGKYNSVDDLLSQFNSDVNLSKTKKRIDAVLPKDGVDANVKDTIVKLMADVTREKDREIELLKRQSNKEISLTEERVKRNLKITQSQLDLARERIISESGGMMTIDIFNTLLDTPTIEQRIREVLDLHVEERAYDKALRERKIKEQMQNTSIRANELNAEEQEEKNKKEQEEKNKKEQEEKNKKEQEDIELLKTRHQNAKRILIRVENFLTSPYIIRGNDIEEKNKRLQDLSARSGVIMEQFQDYTRLQAYKKEVENDIEEMERMLSENSKKGVK